MTSTIERNAADVQRAGDVFIRSHVASAEVNKTPTAWLGQYVEFCAMGADLYIRFGTADTVTVDFTTASALDGGTKVLTAAASGPHLIVPAGTSKHERIKKTMLYFAHIASAASGRWTATLSVGDGTTGAT